MISDWNFAMLGYNPQCISVYDMVMDMMLQNPSGR